MEYTTKYKGRKITIAETEDPEYPGYEVKISRGLLRKPAVSYNEYPNATQALKFAKGSIDNGAEVHDIPKGKTYRL